MEMPEDEADIMHDRETKGKNNFSVTLNEQLYQILPEAYTLIFFPALLRYN